MKLLRAFCVATALLAASPGAACGDISRHDVSVECVPDGMVVAFRRPARVLRMEVWLDWNNETKRSLVLSENLPDRPVSRYRLFFARHDRDLGTLRIFPRDGTEPLIEQTVLVLPLPPSANISLEVPYTGQTDVAYRWTNRPDTVTSFVAPGSEVTAAVQVFMPKAPFHAELTVHLPKGVVPAKDLPDWRVSGTRDGMCLRRGISPTASGEIATFLLPVKVTAEEGMELAVAATLGWLPAPLADDHEVTFDESDFTGEISKHVRLRVASVAKMAEMVRVDEVLMPTDPFGKLDVQRPRDTVALPSGAVLGLRRLLGISEQYFDYYAPWSHETVVFENRSVQRIPLAVSSRITSLDDNAPAPGFRAPDYLVGPDGTYTTTAELAPGEKTSVVLPVFVRPDALLPGRYRSIVEARILGADTLVCRVEHEIVVRSPDLRALIVTLAAALLSVAGLATLFAMRARLFRAFRVSELVLCSLFATMTFALAIVPGSFLGPVFSALAGPFAFLFQGVFFEVVRVLVLVTLLVLVPKPGAVALVSLVRYLLGGLVFGGFSPVDILYLGSSVTLAEAVLYLGGVTSRGGVLSRREVGLAGILYVALLVGLVNAGVQYATYCLNISLYRLYFADWFIALAVGVNGFLYAVLGALPGMKLGYRLRRISE